MLESAGNCNLGFQSDEANETLQNELNENRNEQRRNSACSVTVLAAVNSMATVATALSHISRTTHNGNLSKRVSDSVKEAEVAEIEIKLYKKRFWILGLFSACSMLNGMQWAQYTVNSDVTKCFYGVDLNAVNWTANLYLVLYTPLVFPVSWLMQKIGIRNSLLIGSLLNCISTAVQCACTTPGTFAFVLLSQAIAATAQIFILSLPPYISAVWFGENELSRASAVGVFGNQLGAALGFIFSPLVVPTDCSNKAAIAQGRSIVAYTLTSCNSLLFLLILFTFKKHPDKPPSLAQAKKMEYVSDFKHSVCELLKNVNYDLLLISYGIIAGTALAIGIILFSLMSTHFQGREQEIGLIGLTAIFSGTLGSVIGSYILDKTHRYKETTLAIFILAFVSTILLAGMLYVNLMWLQFITFGMQGFFLMSFMPIGFEFAVEITYPAPEAVASTLLVTSSMILGLVFTEISSRLLQSFSDIAASAFLCSALLLGTTIVAFVKCDFRRREQER